MSTTLLFVELLIIGIQASVWLFLLSIIMFGSNWLSTIINASMWETMTAVILLSFSYVIGIIIDRIADLTFGKWDKAMTNNAIPNPSVPTAVIRYKLGKDNENLNRQFEYIRSRIKISRASSINFALGTIFGIWVVLQQITIPKERMAYIIAISIAGFLFTIGAVYSWHELTRTYLSLLKNGWDNYLHEKELAEDIKNIIRNEKKKSNAMQKKAG